MQEARTVALVSLVAIAPLAAIVIVVALLRGYTIDLHMTRYNKRRRGDDDE